MGGTTEPAGVSDAPAGSVPEVALLLPSPGRHAKPWAHYALEAASIAAVWLVGAYFFFHTEWSNGFRLVMGDGHDSVYITFLMNHWFQVIHGQSSWRSPAFFYPVKDVLGWSEGFFLFDVLFAPLRLVGFDLFMAAQITLILLSLIGFATFVVLTRVAFGAERVVALIGALAFTFANNLWLHLYWYQLLVVWMLPGIFLLGFLAFRGLELHRTRSVVLGVACALLAALTFFTGFYVAWFCTVGLGVALVVLLIAGRRALVTRFVERVRASWWLVVVMAVTFAVGMIPFLATYLPAQKVVRSLSYGTIMRYAPRARDLLNVGTGNVLWTSSVHSLVTQFDLTYSALDYAITPIVMVLAVAGAGLALWVSRGEKRTGWLTPARWAAVLATTAVVMSVLPVNTRFGSLWAVVWHIPGASAIRRTNRIGVVTGLAATLAMVIGMSVVYRAVRNRPYRFLAQGAIVVLLLLAAAEQVNTTPMAGLPRSAELAFLHRAKPPPPGCRSFYVIDTTHSGLSPTSAGGHQTAVADQLDAMLVSAQYGIPTINGYSGYTPANWGLMSPYAPGYLGGVSAWADEYHLQRGLCQLDLGNMQWQRAPAALVSSRGA